MVDPSIYTIGFIEHILWDEFVSFPLPTLIFIHRRFLWSEAKYKTLTNGRLRSNPGALLASDPHFQTTFSVQASSIERSPTFSNKWSITDRGISSGIKSGHGAGLYSSLANKFLYSSFW
jgi:hypothetical protein